MLIILPPRSSGQSPCVAGFDCLSLAGPEPTLSALPAPKPRQGRGVGEWRVGEAGGGVPSFADWLGVDGCGRAEPTRDVLLCAERRG